MYILFLKEIRSFLSSIIGYLAVVVFLALIGLFMWVFTGDLNVLDSGYASLESLFSLAPWVFLFLGPAITMRSFSEEKRTGTIELLLTRPLTEFQIVFAKFLAGFVLVIMALLPTLLYYWSVYSLGNPVGNIDTGGTWGSYIGLLFLSGAFVAIGIFASALSSSQIVAFILAVFLSLFCYIGFDQLSFLMFEPLDTVMLNLGINEHYISMSRGVIDTRDMLYFVSLIAVFLLGTKTVLESRKW